MYQRVPVDPIIKLNEFQIIYRNFQIILHALFKICKQVFEINFTGFSVLEKNVILKLYFNELNIISRMKFIINEYSSYFGEKYVCLN